MDAGMGTRETSREYSQWSAQRLELPIKYQTFDKVNNQTITHFKKRHAHLKSHVIFISYLEDYHTV
jgi:hypothetical protein